MLMMTPDHLMGHGKKDQPRSRMAVNREGEAFRRDRING
jgi:hypothetical protein